ncbi:uncharacterized protein BHQ10_000883 [Talaromyces amestolkiae]|uniref:Uncharacterized protein n=1 Tax=Talaromyces amestolkiae TaxID=1196081 RepID=A0A364KMX9_TALAM|nr:uncharacterized protein BHQ10_000883 [Talaromyces amestolkiae]RAO64871.1 hypothetical protein BHQ10_000883 [Talaromyces amestolkiae]
MSFQSPQFSSAEDWLSPSIFSLNSKLFVRNSSLALRSSYHLVLGSQSIAAQLCANLVKAPFRANGQLVKQVEQNSLRKPPRGSERYAATAPKTPYSLRCQPGESVFILTKAKNEFLISAILLYEGLAKSKYIQSFKAFCQEFIPALRSSYQLVHGSQYVAAKLCVNLVKALFRVDKQGEEVPSTHSDQAPAASRIAQSSAALNTTVTVHDDTSSDSSEDIDIITGTEALISNEINVPSTAPATSNEKYTDRVIPETQDGQMLDVSNAKNIDLKEYLTNAFLNNFKIAYDDIAAVTAAVTSHSGIKLANCFYL